MPEFEQFDLPLRIGVVGDTHRTSHNRRPLPDQLLAVLRGCDLILHLGDFNAGWVAEALADIAPLRGVVGNNDEPEFSSTLPAERFLQLGRHRLGMLHGHLGPGTGRENAFQRMYGLVDCAVYGHSHRAEVIEREGMMMVNPGSPTQRRFSPHHTCATLTVDDRIEPELIILDVAAR